MISRVSVANYTSIANCTVELHPLTFLVGPNGAGKSNFIRVLSLVSTALRSTLSEALFSEIAPFPFRAESPEYFQVRFDFEIAPRRSGHYAFEVRRNENNPSVEREECVIAPHFFRVESGSVTHTSVLAPPPALSDRLYLVNASGLPDFRPVYDLLSRMFFYNPDPDSIRFPMAFQNAAVLERKGRNLESIFDRLPQENKKTITELLRAVLPDIAAIHPDRERRRLRFSMRSENPDDRIYFYPENMSDGTLRLIALLVALYQTTPDGSRPSLIGIEEPELGLHPAAMGVLLDAMREASATSQIIATSHSPELLDNKDIPTDSIVAVSNGTDGSHIGPVDESSRSVLRDKLFTPGELLRMRQLNPAVADNQSVTIFDQQSVG